MERLRRKIDAILAEWSANKERMPLIIKGARQIGKTEAISHFAGQHYQNVIAINFVLQKEYRSIFDDGYEVKAAAFRLRGRYYKVCPRARPDENFERLS